ncbi:MAG: hypothetical protein H8D80_00510 [Proteobacteria bacterium]|nr:hypothetical protein [Pseudomonadota bacterium]
MKSIKQVISEANFAIRLSEQTTSGIDDELASRLRDAMNDRPGHIPGPGNLEDFLTQFELEKRNNWLNNERARQIQAEIQQRLKDSDETKLSVPTFDVDMNQGLGTLPDMNLGFDLELDIPEDEPVQDDGWGFGNNDPHYFNLDTPRWRFDG